MVALAGAVAFHAIAQALVLGTGLLGLTLARPFAWAILGLSALGACALARRFRTTRTAAPAVDAPPEPPPPFAVGLVAAVAVAWCLWTWGQAAVLAWLREPIDWDGLYYHLPALNGWVGAGRVAWLADVPDLPFANGYPLGAEALSFLVYQAFGTSRLVDAVNLFYWPLASFAVATVAGLLGARGAWPVLAGALVFVAPAFVSQSVTCYTDPAFSACVMAGLAALAVARDAAWRGRWEAAVLLGAAIGLVGGVKGTGAPYGAVLFAAGAFVALRAAEGRSWRRRVAWPALVAVVSLLVGGGWYARNLAHTGNAVFPVQVKIGAHVLREGYDMPRMLRDNMPPWLARVPGTLRAPYAWLQPDAPVHGYAPTTGMGFAWLLGGLPALGLAWGLRRRLWPAGAAFRAQLATLTVVAAVMFAFQSASWWARFTVWLHALGLACLVAVVARLRERAGNVARAGLLAWIVALGAVGAWEAQTAISRAWGEARRPDPTRPAELFLSGLEYIAPGLPDSTGGPDGFVAARRVARSPWSRMGTLLGGALAMPLGRREVTFLADAPGADGFAGLAGDGVEWVVWDVPAVGPPPPELLAAAAEVRSYRTGDDVDFRFLRLRR